ncbi:non-structural maintenance of chromosomes element 1 homolog [Ochlerotatus camptorhynchus]|uniref:non-structural maintenance of chromosomes element 1 homolog n=1 Tax=Ochlerotatus camptorhynchus TaxID=644619 RepID=UPI0031D6358F
MIKMISAYSNVHRAFLQSCVLHSIIPTDQALKVLTHLIAKFTPNDPPPTEERLLEVVVEINARIGRFEQRVIRLEYDPTLTTYFVFTNLSDTPLDRLQTTYPEAELSFFRMILHELARTDGHRMGQIDCLNLTTKLEPGRNLTKSRAEVLIQELQSAGYLALEKHEVGFGPRTMVEFDRYLANNFPDQMQHCRLCKEVLFYGVNCTKCPEMFHKVCMKKYLQRLKKCPACKQMWTASLQ